MKDSKVDSFSDGEYSKGTGVYNKSEKNDVKKVGKRKNKMRL